MFRRGSFSFPPRTNAGRIIAPVFGSGSLVESTPFLTAGGGTLGGYRSITSSSSPEASRLIQKFKSNPELWREVYNSLPPPQETSDAVEGTRGRMTVSEKPKARGEVGSYTTIRVPLSDLEGDEEVGGNADGRPRVVKANGKFSTHVPGKNKTGTYRLIVTVAQKDTMVPASERKFLPEIINENETALGHEIGENLFVRYDSSSDTLILAFDPDYESSSPTKSGLPSIARASKGGFSGLSTDNTIGITGTIIGTEKKVKKMRGSGKKRMITKGTASSGSGNIEL